MIYYNYAINKNDSYRPFLLRKIIFIKKYRICKNCIIIACIKKLQASVGRPQTDRQIDKKQK